MRRPPVLFVILATLVLPVLVVAQSSTPARSDDKEAPAKEMFLQYCASCHGPSGKGDGPAAQALKTRPADLTTLAARNGGQFPEMRVMGAIKAGPRVPAHGSETMPVWGPIFADTESSGHGRESQLKVYNLMEYIKTLQVKTKG